MTSLTKCPICGRDLFKLVEENGKSKFVVFTSYGYSPSGPNDQIFYCYECYENRNKKIFKENEDE